jgi:hypothetical protein
MKYLTFFLLVCAASGWSQPADLSFSGFPDKTDVGAPKIKGKAAFDPVTQSWLLEGAGYNMWNTRDEFFFVYRKLTGDAIFSANLNFPEQGVDPHRKAGLMFRASLEEDAPYVDVAIHGDGLTSIQYRAEKGGETREVAAPVKNPDFIQLEKSGDHFVLRVSKDKTAPDEVASVRLQLPEVLFAGIFICSHNPDVLEKAIFTNVRLDIPAEMKGGEQAPPSPSRLEVLDMKSGLRKILFETPDHIEAPNWSRNGKFLIYNKEGKLYRYELKSGKISVI